jgi:hypothetical protein
MSGGIYLERLPGAVEDVHVERRGPEGGVGGGVVGEAEELILQSEQRKRGLSAIGTGSSERGEGVAEGRRGPTWKFQKWEPTKLA